MERGDRDRSLGPWPSSRLLATSRPAPHGASGPPRSRSEARRRCADGQTDPDGREVSRGRPPGERPGL